MASFASATVPSGRISVARLAEYAMAPAITKGWFFFVNITEIVHYRYFLYRGMEVIHLLRKL